MRSDGFLQNKKQHQKMCIDQLEPETPKQQQQQQLPQELKEIGTIIELNENETTHETQSPNQENQEQQRIAVKQSKTSNLRSRKSLQLSDIMLFNNKDISLSEKIEQLDKKLQILNEANSKLYTQQQDINKLVDNCDKVYDFLKPKKSCLPSKPCDSNMNTRTNNENDTSKDETKWHEKQQSRKNVTFADAHGKDLYSIRQMNEPSDCPPKLQSKIVKFLLDKEFNDKLTNDEVYDTTTVDCLTQDIEDKNANETEINNNNGKYDTNTSATRPLDGNAAKNGNIIIYSLNFEQPAGDYLLFQETLTNGNVSLENVILDRFNINGTIKVKNICFHKTVFVRCTFDNWLTHADYQATYVPNTFQFNTTTQTSTIDTFKFEFNLPNKKSTHDAQINLSINKLNTLKQFKSTFNNTQPCPQQSNQIQFCVCFKSDDQREYWDNNRGKNYSIMKYVLNLNIQTTSATVVDNNKSSPIKAATSTKTNRKNLQSLIQEQHLSTLVDNYFQNWVYNQRYKTPVSFSNGLAPTCLPSAYKSSATHTTSSSQWQASGSDLNVPYW